MLRYLGRLMIGVCIHFGLITVLHATSTCATSEYDAVKRCYKHLHRKNCACTETVSAANQCFRYGKKTYQCTWN